MAETCAQCGLPIGGHGLRATIGDRSSLYCCVGCVVTRQVTRTPGEEGDAALLLVRLGVAIFFAINTMMVSMPTYVPAIYGGVDPTSLDGPLFVVLRWLALVLALPVLLLLGAPIADSAWQAWRAGVPNADGLIVVGTVAAYALSVLHTIRGETAVYFDTAAMLLVLVTLGRWLEARARTSATAAIRSALRPAPALVTRWRDGTEADVPPGDLVAGDRITIGPGAVVPTDGVIVDGRGSLDESALTGEPHPVTKHPGAAVAGGTCSIDGTFTVRVIRPMGASAAARIAALTEAALSDRSQCQRIADRAVGWLVPIIIAAAFTTGSWWAWVGDVDQGILTALAVLVVACPCGLGIATPLALWVGLAEAARHGVVIRGASTLEQLASIRTVLFDKTGTLTSPVPEIAGITVENGITPNELLALAAAVEHHQPHPFARAIVAAAPSTSAAAATHVEVVPGRGVLAVVGSREIHVGTRGWVVGTPDDDDGSRVAVAIDGVLAGTIAFREAPHRHTADAIAALRALGLRVGVLTGAADARALVPGPFTPDEITTGLTPAGKLAAVRDARSGGVAMVGDGFNDAPALAAADVGIAVADATDLARLTADVVLTHGGIGRLPDTVRLARRVVRVARQNLLWAFAYNAGAVVLAVTGRLGPLTASLAMIASSLAVVGHARHSRMTCRSKPFVPSPRPGVHASSPAVCSPSPVSP